MRSVLSILAAVLAFVAAVISIADGDADLVPFFLVLTVVASFLALLTVSGPWQGPRRLLGRLMALAWTGTAIWIGGLLVLYQVTCACSSPVPETPSVYFGLEATAYHLAATFGGAALVVVAAFGGRRGGAMTMPDEGVEVSGAA